MSIAVSPATSRRFEALDGWRGICAVLVALLHFITTSHISPLPLVRNAHLFVDFFFVLSGFVMTHAYLGRLSTARQAGTMIWRRLWRLWPLHLALLAAFVALEFASPIIAALTGAVRRSATVADPASSALMSAIPSNILLLHGLGLHDRLTWNMPSWSISVEFWTYVVFALVIVATRRWSALAAGAVAVVGAIVVATCSTNVMATTFDFGFFRCLYGFFVGHLVYRLLDARSVAGSSARLCAPTLVEAAVTIAIVAYVSCLGYTEFELAAPIVLGVGVWVFAHEQGAISKLLKMRFFAALGAWSYSIYMVHSLVIVVIHRALTVLQQRTGQTYMVDVQGRDTVERVVSIGSPFVMDALTLVYLVCVIGVAALTWRWIEQPGQRPWRAFKGRSMPLARTDVASVVSVARPASGARRAMICLGTTT